MSFPLLSLAQNSVGGVKLFVTNSTIESSWSDSIGLNTTIYNHSDSSYVLYNFNDNWSEAGMENMQHSDYSPGFHSFWDPGLNVGPLVGIYLFGRTKLVNYLNPASVSEIRQRGIEALRKSRKVLKPHDSLSVSLVVSLREVGTDSLDENKIHGIRFKHFAKLPKGTYWLFVYYEMNKHIFKYVPYEPRIFMGRLKSNKVTLIIK